MSVLGEEPDTKSAVSVVYLQAESLFAFLGGPASSAACAADGTLGRANWLPPKAAPGGAMPSNKAPSQSRAPLQLGLRVQQNVLAAEAKAIEFAKVKCCSVAVYLCRRETALVVCSTRRHSTGCYRSGSLDVRLLRYPVRLQVPHGYPVESCVWKSQFPTPEVCEEPVKKARWYECL